ncbi:mitogen-activated protein kinase kinase kinase 12-like [Amphiura filiformis]|uniref:mitogen-activated protein kinase kinase kinase 12-like n=1 Tax=Amphiura filiformis TaxID=82378 RepID=UPI003B21252C
MDFMNLLKGATTGFDPPVHITHKGRQFQYQTKIRLHSLQEPIKTDVKIKDIATGTSVNVHHFGPEDAAVDLAKDRLLEELQLLGHVPQHNVAFEVFEKPPSGQQPMITTHLTAETSSQSTDHLKYSDMITHNPPIGSGKFGTVFRVTFKQGSYKGHVLAAAKNLRIMNAKEIHILKTAHHPHIVSFIDYVQEGMMSVIVTELADESLRARLNRNRGGVSEALQEKWITECASAIKYLHDGLPDANGTWKPVVHRDIKADNCLLFAGDLVKLCDFGIAEETDHTTGTSSRKGTEAWMAPELLMSSKFSTASDIYAFGVLIWEITTQEMPTAHQDVRGARIWGQPIRYTFPIYMEDLLPLCWKIDRHDRPTIDGVIARLPQESATTISSNNDTGSSASTESEIDLK